MSSLIVEHPVVDRVLDVHRAALGDDFDGYRNHIYRVASFFNELGPNTFGATPALAVAAAFHDIGIWVEHTVDYLEPSARLAQQFLESERLDQVDGGLVHELIVQHHKLRRYRTNSWAELVEQWRKADHVDVSLGLLTFGVPRARIRHIQHRLPDRGFHLRLLQLTIRQFARRPWNPLPMVRW